MTTRRHAVRRERPSGWPIFEGHVLAGDLETLAVEVNRSPKEAIPAAVTAASKLLAPALAHIMRAGGYDLWLLVASGSIDISSRVAAYRSAKLGMWTALEEAGYALPKAERTETKIYHDNDTLSFGGSARVDPSEPGELSAALEMTRRENAILLATDGQEPNPIGEFIAANPAPGSAGPPLFVIAVVGNWDHRAFVARGFGQFDDAIVGVEVFAMSDLLDAVESHLTGNDSRSRTDGQ